MYMHIYIYTHTYIHTYICIKGPERGQLLLQPLRDRRAPGRSDDHRDRVPPADHDAA